jgi:hypothetical protein
MFKFNNGYITNIKNNKVVSVKDRSDVEGQPVWASTRIGGNHPSQRWRVVYVEKLSGNDKFRKKGQ